MRKIAIGILSLFFLLSLIGLAVQSPWGKGKAVSMLTEAIKNQGITVEVDDIQGALPHELLLKGVKLTSNSWSLSFGSLEIRLSLLRLLKREIAFSLIKGDHVRWEKKGETLSFDQSGLPFLLNVEKFQFTDVAIPNLFPANFEGFLRIGKKNRYAFFDISAHRLDEPNAAGRLLLSIQRDGQVLARVQLKTPSLQSLTLASPIEGALKVQAVGRGHWSSFVSPQGDIQGNLKGVFSPKFPQFQFDKFEGPWNFSGQFIRHADHSWTLPKVRAKNSFFSCKGEAVFDASGNLAETELQIQSSHLKMNHPLSFTGQLFAHLNMKREGETVLTKAAWRIPHLGVGAHVVNEVSGNIEGQLENETVKGTGLVTGEYRTEKWEAKANFDWVKGSSLNFSSYRIGTDALECKGNLEVRPDGLLAGITELNADQIHPLSESLYGKAVGKVIWFPLDRNGILLQAAQCDIRASDFYWNAFSAQEVSLYSDLIDPFHSLNGAVNLDLEKGKWKTLAIHTASLETNTQGENRPFTVQIDGEWKHPLSLQLDGYWQYNKDSELSISLQDGHGSFFNQLFRLASPISLEWSPSLFRLSDTTLQFSNGSLFVQIDRNGNHTEAHMTAKHMPLDFLSLNPLDVSIGGFFDFDASLKEQANQLGGNFRASLEQMEVVTQDPKDPMGASGNFEGTFERNRLNVKGALTVRESPLLNLDLSLPVHLEIWPFQADLLWNKDVQGTLKLHGRIEDFLDFADLGSHRLEGECNCDLKVYNTLALPLLEGYCDFENGYYQNYFTGTELKNIRAEWLAEKDTFYLRSLTAEDLPGKGSLSATGEIRMNSTAHFPYRFAVTISRFNFLTLDFIGAEAEGKLVLSGNRQQGLAKGDVTIIQTDVTIPERIPRQLPDLQVTYKNPTKPPAPPQPETREPYPLAFDLNIDAPDGIFITGRGLNSEWKGKFHIGGEQTALQAKGQIELIKGEFLFAGRKFKLTEGALIFSGIENEMPFFNLAGTMEVKNVFIVARMKGPLNNPQITLQSTPPLPMGTIMSYLLFGQEMSEINSFQALQLANSLASLAGEGPDVLEATRSSLGVDRLQIISVPGEIEGEDTIAVQVGKYVTEDVLISVSQGAEDPSTNITIEVELKGGLSFVLESQASQEQGKFTLKWTKTY